MLVFPSAFILTRSPSQTSERENDTYPRKHTGAATALSHAAGDSGHYMCNLVLKTAKYWIHPVALSPAE